MCGAYFHLDFHLLVHCLLWQCLNLLIDMQLLFLEEQCSHEKANWNVSQNETGNDAWYTSKKMKKAGLWLKANIVGEMKVVYFFPFHSLHGLWGHHDYWWSNIMKRDSILLNVPLLTRCIQVTHFTLLLHVHLSPDLHLGSSAILQ